MVDLKKVQRATRLLLEGIGEDPQRPGLRDTPRRVAQMWKELVAGMDQKAAQIMTVLPAEEYDEIVLVRDIPVVSMCEHHLVPFIGRAHVAYMPQAKRVTGLSKLARIVEIDRKSVV